MVISSLHPMGVRGPYKVSLTPFCHTGWHLLYQHTADLLCLDFHRPATNQLMAISIPLVPEAWACALAVHPDHAFARYICEGIQRGFRIGFRHGSPLKSAAANMDSVRQHPHLLSTSRLRSHSVGCWGRLEKRSPYPINCCCRSKRVVGLESTNSS